MKKNSDITNISSDADALIKLTSKKADIENLTFSRGNLYRPSVIHCIITARAVFRHWKRPPASSDNNDPECLSGRTRDHCCHERLVVFSNAEPPQGW